MPSLVGAVEKSLKTLLGVFPPPRLGLAISGGVDSMSLSHLTSQWAAKYGINLHGFIVDHQIREGSAIEAAQVASRIENMGIKPNILKLEGVGAQQSTIELNARQARRTALAQACRKHNIQHLLFAHTLDDQLELFILRLLSGSSWYGLAGMLPSFPLDLTLAPTNTRH